MSVDEVAEVDRYETRTVERQEWREKVKGLLSSIFTDVLDVFEPDPPLSICPQCLQRRDSDVSLECMLTLFLGHQDT